MCLQHATLSWKVKEKKALFPGCGEETGEVSPAASKPRNAAQLHAWTQFCCNVSLWDDGNCCSDTLT